jgi:hypothetical protein
MKKHLQLSTRWLFLAAILCCTQLMAHSQEYASISTPVAARHDHTQDPANKLSRKSLRDVLKLLEADYQVSFNFDDDVVKGVNLNKDFTWGSKEKLEKILKRLLPEVNLKF